MTMATLLSVSAFAEQASEPPFDIKSLLRAEGGPRLRRSNRITELALLGALRCAQGMTLPEGCGLYLGSDQGSVGDTTSLLRQIVRDGLEPMPFDFINVSSNMAGYAVAQALGLPGSNCAVARNGGALDSALELALLELAAGTVPMALVGVVEECAWPLAEHRVRLGVGDDTALLEQSDWLLLGTASGGSGVRLSCQRFADAEQALPARRRDENARWLAGPLLPVGMQARVSAGQQIAHASGYSQSVVAHQLVQALAEGGEGPLHYLNGDGADGAVLFTFAPGED